VARLDDVLVEQSIRRRVGEPGTITRVDRGSESILAEFRAVAEGIGGAGVELLTVSDGIPGHFGLRGRNSHSVVFHERQVEACAFLHGVTLEQRFDDANDALTETVFEGTVLRLVAEFMLQGGHPDQALVTLAKSWSVQGGIVMHGPTIAFLEDMARDERYMVEWFFALGHEIGHHITSDVMSDLAALRYFDPPAVSGVADAIIEARFSDADAGQLAEIIRRGQSGRAPRSHAAMEVIRDESIADLFSVICISEAWDVLCAHRVGRDYAPHLLLLEAMISMSSVMVIEQCRIMAGWFSNVSFEAETQSLLLSGVALQARLNLLAMTLRNPEVQDYLAARYPSMEAFRRLDDSAFDAAMIWLESRSLQVAEPFGRARGFLSSPEMREAHLLEAYFEAVATDAATRLHATDFLRVSRHLDGPLLDGLRAVVDGAPPPLVEQVGHT
jgi:hypothetical protein